MKKKKYLFGLLSTILSVGFLFGCNDKKDEAEPDTTEEPSEQKVENDRNNNGSRNVGYQPDRDRNDKKKVDADTPDLKGGPERLVREPHPLSLSDLRKKYSGTFLLNGDRTKREVALTFDDGPDNKFTPQVLDALKKAGVKATFCVVGNRVKAHPEIMKRIIKEGHAIANHSYSHPNFPKLKIEEFRNQITNTDKIIHKVTGYKTSIVRPPYGSINEEEIKWLAHEKKKIVNWDVDSLDWKGLSAEEVSTNILAQVKPGSIILQHSAGGEGEDLSGTVKALPEIISKLKDDGVKFVTVPDMLGIPVTK